MIKIMKKGWDERRIMEMMWDQNNGDERRMTGIRWDKIIEGVERTIKETS